MNADFVSFSLAKKLKEKGFREKCLAFYTSTKSFYYNNTNVCSDVEDLLDCCNENEEYDDVDAPTISQVLKWLREEKNIHIGFGYSPRKKWRHVVMYMDDRFYNKPTLTVDGFLKIEQAAIAGIEYVIDNLI